MPDVPVLPGVPIALPVENNVVVPNVNDAMNPPISASNNSAQLLASFTTFVKFSAQCEELETKFKDLEKEFVAMNGRFNQLLDKVDIVMSVLSSVMNKVSIVENNLSQLVQFQINMNTPSKQPPIVVIEPIDTEIVEVDAKEFDVGNGVSVGNPIVLSDAMTDDVVIPDSVTQID